MPGEVEADKEEGKAEENTAAREATAPAPPRPVVGIIYPPPEVRSILPPPNLRTCINYSKTTFSIY